MSMSESVKSSEAARTRVGVPSSESYKKLTLDTVDLWIGNTIDSLRTLAPGLEPMMIEPLPSPATHV